MRISVLWIGMFLCIHTAHAGAESLQQAMQEASTSHPQLTMAEQGLDVARGQLTEQGAYAYNPELSLEPQRRRLNGGGTSNDYYITLSQGIETGGKRALRQQSARAALDVAAFERDLTRQRLVVEAARAYVTLFFAARTFELRQQQSEILQQVSRAVLRQLELGQSSQLDANLASSASASARNGATVARQALSRSLQRYRIALGRTGAGRPLLAPAPEALPLPKLASNWQVPGDAVQLALASRPDMAALQAKLAQSTARAELASAARLPDVTISAMAGREAGENLIKLGISVPFPVLNSHRGAYRAAMAEQERVDTGMQWSTEQLRYAVQAALDNHATAMRAYADMSSSNMQQMAANTITLARKAYDAGELDLEELVVHIRQGLDARMTALAITQQAWFARIRLAEVLGHPEFILQGTQS